MIFGTVNCGSTSGYIPVYILGESFSAVTTTAGAFRLSNVPEGTYDLSIDTPQSVHHTITSISVTSGMQISLGTIEICCADNFTSTCKCPDGQVNTGTQCAVAPSTSCTPGTTKLCPKQWGVCAGSVMTCLSDGTWPADCDYTTIPHYSTTELCDGRDNNCNGTIDEDFPKLGAPCGTCGDGYYRCSADGLSTVCWGASSGLCL